MLIQIKYNNQRDFYQKYLTFLNPLLKLNKTDNLVLSSYLTLNEKYKEYNPEVLNKLLFSDDTKKSIIQKLKITDKQFNKSFSTLKNKEYITDKGINTRFLHPALKKDTNINFIFTKEEKNDK